MKYVGWLWHNTSGARLNIALRILLGTAQVALSLLMVCLSKRFIDETIRTGSDQDVIRMVAFLVATIVGGVVVRQVYNYLTVSCTARKVNEIRLHLFSALFRRELYGESTLHSGDVTSRFSKDVESANDVSLIVIPQAIVTGLQLVGAFLLMRFFDARLAWALVLFTPVAVVVGKFVSHKMRKMTLAIRESESRVQVHVQEGVEHNEVLRSLGSEGFMMGKLDSEQNRLRGNVMHRARFTIGSRFVLSCTFGLGYMMAFVWGGLGLRSGAITFGVMTSFLQLVGMIQNPVLSLLNMAPQVIHSTASIDRLEELEGGTAENAFGSAAGETGSTVGTATKIDAEDGAAENAGAKTAATLRFENVTFRYAKGDSEVLKDFSHEFKAGSKTAVMGETGIGKTTLFRLALGFVQPDSGTVRAPARENFVFVPQGNSLMSGSIRYNLLLAKPDATDEELWQVLKTACAEFVKELPDALDFELEERGAGLSEGQAQRIAIARGLLRPGAIMLLDEISSALDEETERELYSRLFAANPQKTMVIITHRKAACDLCDEIVKI
ncbi:ABC transporter ATP-binding protein [Fibrobacter sp.]|uniref:ABC transporter ATP-binding protein n=1 Tax=Fibrobacter sp. TaxID=35828 RepID=UPI00388CF42A